MSALTLGLNKSPVLPPIISHSDKTFLKSIERYVTEEMEQLGCDGEGNVENLYVIYRNVFDKVIEYATSYKNILTSIKQEYDNFIDTIKRGQKDAFYLHAKLKVLASEPTTLMYYKKRATQLKDKIEIIEKDSTKILHQIQDTHAAMKLKSPAVQEAIISGERIHHTVCIPGMTTEDSLNIDALAKYQFQLEKKMLDLKTEMKTKYVSAEVKVELDQALELALRERDEAALENAKLVRRYKRGKVITAAISTWAKSDKRKKLSAFISGALAKEDASADDLEDDQVATRLFEDDDPSKIKEADDLLEYIERFNELFKDGQYEAASVYASNCPRGVLRNIETMEKFKAVPATEGKIPPLLIFFEALINSSTAAKEPISASMTLEGIKCALMQKRLDLVIHWITQQRLTFSESLGDAIFEHIETNLHSRTKCLALAQIIYRQCAVHRKAALCMCALGQMCGVMEYIHQCKQFSFDDFLFLLKNCPSNELIHCLTHKWNGKPAALSIGQAVLSLICTDHKEYGFQLLEKVHNCEEGELENVILNDMVCTPEGWTVIADECSKNNYISLSLKIKSILKSQDGVVEISPNDDDAKIMEHVFL